MKNSKDLTTRQRWKIRKGLCIERFCRNESAEKRRICYRCKARKYKARHPIKHLFNIKKQRAKERGHKWDLTCQEFEEFVLRTGYMDRRGRGRNGMSIDRIDPDKGYTIDNIQTLTVSENSKKYHCNGKEYIEPPF